MNSAIIALIISPILVIGYTWYQVSFFDSAWEDQPSGDCLLIMGSKVLMNNQPDLMMKERVSTAQDHISDSVQTIILTGGKVDTDKTEAGLMKEILVKQGVEADKILLEEQSSSTYENLLFSIPLIESAQCQKLDIISNDFHLARIKMTAKRLGIDVNRLIPARNFEPNSPDRIFREYKAYLWYLLGWRWLEN